MTRVYILDTLEIYWIFNICQQLCIDLIQNLMYVLLKWISYLQWRPTIIDFV